LAYRAKRLPVEQGRCDGGCTVWTTAGEFKNFGGVQSKSTVFMYCESAVEGTFRDLHKFAQQNVEANAAS